MPTRIETNFARPKNKDEFERLIRDICRLEWHDESTELYGRIGQKQFGVDIYGQPAGLGGSYRAAQCKLRSTNMPLTEVEIENEVQEAKLFPHELDILIIATDAPRDTKTQEVIDKINEQQEKVDSFRIVIWFWESICERIASYPSLIVRYYSDYFSNLTSVPYVEKLVDIPIQLLSVVFPQTSSRSEISEALLIRGVRLTSLGDVNGESIEENLPDGTIFQYLKQNSDSLLSFASIVSAYLEKRFPIFVVITSDLVSEFISNLQLVGGNSSAIHLYTLDQTASEIASDIFTHAFIFGYQRRGSLATINISVRSSPTRSNACLLDVNWQSCLSTKKFPTTDEWNNILSPALNDVLQLVTQQGDRTRVQIRPVLPLPAAFAWGFSFNLRVARLAVWARELGVSDLTQQLWLSDGEPGNISIQYNWISQPGSQSKTAIVEMTSGLTIHQSVKEFISKNKISYDGWLQIGIDNLEKPEQNFSEGWAVAYARKVGQIIREANQAGIVDIHLFLRMPSALAVLVGQQLQACGRIHLYWFDNPTYRFAFTLS